MKQLVLLTFLLVACKPDTEVPVLPDARLQLEWKLRNGGAAFAQADTIRDADGLLVAVERIRFQLGELWLQDDLHRVLRHYPDHRWYMDTERMPPVLTVGGFPPEHVHTLVLTLAGDTAEAADHHALFDLAVDTDASGTIDPSDPRIRIRVPARSTWYYAMVDVHADPDPVPGEEFRVPIVLDIKNMLRDIHVSPLLTSEADATTINTFILALVAALRSEF